MRRRKAGTETAGQDTREAAVQAIRELRTSIANMMVQLSAVENRLSYLTQELILPGPLPSRVEQPEEGAMERLTELVSVRDLIKELRISRTTLYNLKSRSDFPKPVDFKHRRTLFRRSEILIWLEKQHQ